MKTIFDFNFKNEIALIRVDFNVPQDTNLNITDNTRILSVKPTIHKILSDGGKIVLMSHLGRPKGKFCNKYSFRPIVDSIAKLLGISLKFVSDCIGEEVNFLVSKLKFGDVLLLENLRFYSEEEKGDLNFAKKLSKYGTIYVNEAFSASHRNHSSIVGIVNFFQKKCFGLLVEKELYKLNYILKFYKTPFTAILGGNKISTKIFVVNKLLSIVNNLIIGGGMVYTFIKVLGGKIGNSIFEKNSINIVNSILEKAKKNKVNIYLPVDTLSSNIIHNLGVIKECAIDNIPDNFFGLDIGNKSIKIFTSIILNSKTILWNGPLGVFEINKFAYGTKCIVDAIGKVKNEGGFSFAGGGDSLAFIKKYNCEKNFSYISTGGGAMLEYLEGKKLPGVSAILNSI